MTFTQKIISCCLLFFACFSGTTAWASNDQHPIADEVARYSKEYENLDYSSLLSLLPLQDVARYQVDDELDEATFFALSEFEVTKLRLQAPNLLKLQLPTADGKLLNVQLYKANVFTDAFQVTLASQPDRAYPYEAGLYYWGIVEGDEQSLVAFAITEEEMMGFVQSNGVQYSLGKLNDHANRVHVFYENSELKEAPPIDCQTNDEEHYIGNKVPNSTNVTMQKDASNCVRMYVEVDHTIFLDKGGVSQAANYVNGAFSQVAILYANEFIDLVVNELFVWDVPDPYTGPSAGNYLNQFRNNLNGNFNGDLAHLVSYGGGGGVAYLDVLCGNTFRVAYSGINPNYNNVPTYSWTVMVITHEIGHNLGSPHTHSCSWNGNNTAIDGCGFQAGAGGCNAALPDAGTIMSYCHLFGGIGIDLALGFGPQPGNLIRNEVYNANCLSACTTPSLADAGISSIIQPQGALCSNTASPTVTLRNYGTITLNSVSIDYSVDGQNLGSFNWNGNLNPNASTNISLPTILVSPGSHTFTASTSNPNGDLDDDTSNDSSTSGYNLSDSDNDGVCDVQDICPGGDDNIDTNGNGIPDDCDCPASFAYFPINPLTHVGTGSSSTTTSLPANSSNVFFTISDINALLAGRPANRFIEVVTVSYVNGSGFTQQYGVFNGSQIFNVDISISGIVQSITLSLTDGYDGDTDSELKVTMSPVSYCNGSGGGGGGCDDDDNDGICNADDICPGFNDNLIGTPCNDGDACTINDVYTLNCDCVGTYQDSDNDGVCDADDICPGGNDNVDSDGDGTPDDCDSGDGCNNAIVANFSPNPLTNAGPGSSTSSLSIPAGSTDISFTVFNINAKLRGRPGDFFNESVTISYVDAGGATQVYGTFNGNEQDVVDVSIAGPVQSVSISLSDAYDGTYPPLSVNMTAVNLCADGGATINPASGGLTTGNIRLFPNPTQDYAVLAFGTAPEKATVIVRDLLGQTVAQYQLIDQAFLQLPVAEWTKSNQVYLVSIYVGQEEPITKRLVVTH